MSKDSSPRLIAETFIEMGVINHQLKTEVDYLKDCLSSADDKSSKEAEQLAGLRSKQLLVDKELLRLIELNKKSESELRTCIQKNVVAHDEINTLKDKLELVTKHSAATIKELEDKLLYRDVAIKEILSRYKISSADKKKVAQLLQ